MKLNAGGYLRYLTGIILFVCIYLLLSGFTEVNIGNNSVHTGVVVINGRTVSSTGSSPVVSETRKVGNFSSLDIAGSFQVEINCGTRPGLVIVAEKRLLPKIVSKVKGRTLKIFIRGNISTGVPLRLEITVPELYELQAEGASDIALTCSSNHLYVNLEDSANVVASGSVSALRLILNGASEFDASKYRASTVFLEARDSSTATVNVLNRLDASAYGASEVQYYGMPAHVNAMVHDGADIEAAQ